MGHGRSFDDIKSAYQNAMKSLQDQVIWKMKKEGQKADLTGKLFLDLFL